MRTLALQDAGLQAYLTGTGGIFRWFNPSLPPGYIDQGTCIRLLRVSTIREYLQEGLVNMSQPRFQFDVMDYDRPRCWNAKAALVAWLQTIDLASNAQFGSIVTTPPQFPTFILNERQSTAFQTSPSRSDGIVVYIESVDVRLYNLEN